MRKKEYNLAFEISKGDIASFDLFYKSEFDNIVFFINSYLHDDFRAEDIAQESLLTLWEKREIIDPERNIRALLYTIAKNKTLNELKSKSASLSIDNLNEINVNILALKDDSLSEEIEALSLRELIENTIDNLPDTVRDSFIMSRHLGMTNKEIAEAKNMSLTGIEYHMKISIKIFREKLKDYLAFGVWFILSCIINS